MKVLFVNTVCGRSSTGRIITDINDLLRECGDEALCVYGRYDAPDTIHSVKIDGNLDVYRHVAITRLFDRQGFGSAFPTRQIRKIIEEFAPDVIHLHNLHGNYLNIKILFDILKEVDIPVVWTIHDCWAFTGHCVYYDYIGCTKWKSLCSMCPKKKEYPKSVFLDQSKRNYIEKKNIFTSYDNITVVTVSDWLKDQVKMSFMNKYPVHRIYNGINQDVFKPKDSDIKEKLGISGKFVILGVSDGWSERKGISYFMYLAKSLMPDEIIVMVGLKKEEIKSLPKGIIGLERTDSVEELVKIYSMADVVLNPSYEETFGLITAEALSCGTPVIVLNATASPELVDNSCGRIVQKGDYEGVRQAIFEIKNNPITHEACINCARRFDKRITYKEYIDLYRRLMK